MLDKVFTNKERKIDLSLHKFNQDSPITTAFAPAKDTVSLSFNATSMPGIFSVAGPYTWTPSVLSSMLHPTWSLWWWVFRICVRVHPLLSNSRLYEAAQGVSTAAVWPVLESWIKYLARGENNSIGDETKRFAKQRCSWCTSIHHKLEFFSTEIDTKEWCTSDNVGKLCNHMDGEENSLLTKLYVKK